MTTVMSTLLLISISARKHSDNGNLGQGWLNLKSLGWWIVSRSRVETPLVWKKMFVRPFRKSCGGQAVNCFIASSEPGSTMLLFFFPFFLFFLFSFLSCCRNFSMNKADYYWWRVVGLKDVRRGKISLVYWQNSNAAYLGRWHICPSQAGD